MNITILGGGNIGSTLGSRWAQAGYTISFGVRQADDPKYAELQAIGCVATIGDALAQAEVVVVAIPGGAVAELVATYRDQLAGKIIIDATNNPRSATFHNLDALREIPQAKLLRAFSTLGWENFANPQIDGIPIDLFYCGHAEARSIADQLISAIGLHPIYLGDLEAVTAVDGLTRAWFALAFGQGYGRRVAFRLIHEPA
ncbi:MAG: NADPH-dependent F420 reductase [Roseiflexaceae bacterium]